MPSLPLSFFPLFALWVSEAFGAITASAPSNVPQCNPTTFSWQGGAAPFTLLFNTTGDMPIEHPIAGQTPETVPIMMALQFGNINDFSYKTPIYFLRGSPVSFQVTDSKNESSNVASFSMTAGDNNACEVKYYPSKPLLDWHETDEGPVKLDAPDVETDACDDYFFVDWETTGTPPYVFTIQTRGLSVLQAATFGNLSGGIPNIQIPFPPGVQIELGVQDYLGTQDFSLPITIQPFVVPRNACVISNLTQPDSKVPVPTTTLPFPSFYALGSLESLTTSRPTFTGTSFTFDPTPTSHAHGPEGDPSDFDTSDTGKIVGIAIGVPLGIFALAGVVALILAVHRQHQRREMIQRYWNARVPGGADAHVLGPRNERYTQTPFM